MNEIKIALLGLGTVGCGVAKILQSHGAELAERAGCRLAFGRSRTRDLTRPREGLDLARLPLTADAGQAIDDPVGADRDRADRRARAGAHLHPAGPAGGQARGHRQQGAARPPRDRAVRGGPAPPASCSASRPRWRAASRSSARSRTGCPRTASSRLRHRQRHLQLHPVQDDRRGPRLRRGPEGGAGARLRGGGSDPRHRGASTPPTSCRSWPRWPSAPRSTSKDIYTEGITAVGQQDVVNARRARLPHQAPRHRQGLRRRARGPRAPDDDPGQLARSPRSPASSTRSSSPATTWAT